MKHLVCRRQSFPYAVLTPYQISLTPACLLATDCYVLNFTLREELLLRDRGGNALSLQDGTACSAALSLSRDPSAP